MTGTPKPPRAKNHETIGSDVLSLYHALQAPEIVLGAETAARIKAMDPTKWYPIAMMSEPLEALATSVGAAGLRKIGRTLFQMSHAEKLRGSSISAEELCASFDRLYHSANRGENIGGWRVLRFDETAAELEDTTPHPCALEEGIVTEALKAINVVARVEQRVCVNDGASSCIFHIEPIRRDRWMKR